jgi:hypothetical protein
VSPADRDRESKRRRDRESKRRRRALAAGLEPRPPGRVRRVSPPTALAVPDLRGAACSGEDPELWFSASAEDQAKAKRICHGCPVRRACWDAAERNGEQAGIWGGIDRDPEHVRVLAS